MFIFDKMEIESKTIVYDISKLLNYSQTSLSQTIDGTV